jgi:hypothetical protein
VSAPILLPPICHDDREERGARRVCMALLRILDQVLRFVRLELSQLDTLERAW